MGLTQVLVLVLKTSHLSPTTTDGQSPAPALGTFDFSAANQPAICSSETLPY